MQKQYPILALWAVPRSVSTAFERIMSARGDMTVFNEPFSAHYYFGPGRSNTRYPAEAPGPGNDPAACRAAMIAAASDGPVFFKDMAYHIATCMSAEFIVPFQSAILVRDPEYSIPSLYKKLPEFTAEETGFEQLLQLARLICDTTGAPPIVMDGQELRTDPETVYRGYCEAVGIEFMPDALSWRKGEEEHWNRWGDWYTKAANSEGILPPEASPDDEIVSIPKVAEAIAYCRPYYEELMKLRLQTQ